MMDKANRNIPKFKVVLLGEVGVGKTSLYLRVRDGDFKKESLTASLGVDNCSCTLKAGAKMVQLTIWDTAGAEKFRTLTRNFYRNAHAVLMTFAVDNPTTLYQLSRWVLDAKEYAPDALLFLVGNKSDEDCLVKQVAMEGFAKSHGCENVFLTSAKTGQGVPEVLATVTGKLVQLYAKQKYDLENSWLEQSIHVNNGDIGNTKKSSGCCRGGRS